MITFETTNFAVHLTALPEYDVDLSWDDDGNVRDALERGLYECFCACVSVTHKPTGLTLAETYLGQCIYADLRDFMEPGGYYRDMAREAVSEARVTLARLRDAA